MDAPSTSAAALREEIARLTGAIHRHKTSGPQSRPTPNSHQGRPWSNVYVNPNYKPPSRPQAPAPQPTATSTRSPHPRPQSLQVPPVTSATRDVVIGGVAFESSGRSLVRKDLTATKAAKAHHHRPSVPPTAFTRSKANAMIKNHHPFKARHGRRGRIGNRNMTLTNTVRPPEGRRRKYVDKPCPRFTTTGACTRGLTCLYTHDPAKVAICWPFLQGSCTHTAATCPLSHDPTPERTPLCVHFANAGRCTRSNCPFPHVRVGVREGVCRDFAVLGYCEKGLDCEHQHVRECPDFAEKGACTTKGCKLPHVIRANRSRPKDVAGSSANTKVTSEGSGTDVTATGSDSSTVRLYAEDAQLGDEFISLTFHESESEEDEDEEEDEEDEPVQQGDEEDALMSDGDSHT